MQLLGDGHELSVAREREERPVEGPVRLGVGGQVAHRRRRDRGVREGPQGAPAVRRDRTGQVQHHGDLDQRPDLGQLGPLAGAAFADPEAAVRHDLDGALDGQPLHRLAHRRRGDPEAGAERGRGVDPAGLQFAVHEGGPQGVQDLPAHGVAPDGTRRGRLVAGVLAMGVLAPGLLGEPGGGGPPRLRRHARPRRRTRKHSGGVRRTCAVVRAALLHRDLLRMPRADSRGPYLVCTIEGGGRSSNIDGVG